jgi:hypothetical protein
MYNGSSHTGQVRRLSSQSRAGIILTIPRNHRTRSFPKHLRCAFCTSIRHYTHIEYHLPRAYTTDSIVHHVNSGSLFHLLYHLRIPAGIGNLLSILGHKHISTIVPSIVVRVDTLLLHPAGLTHERSIWAFGVIGKLMILGIIVSPAPLDTLHV